MSEDRVTSRAKDLLPEEEAVGVDDPQALADAVLQESDERERPPDPQGIEHRTSTEASEPGAPGR